MVRGGILKDQKSDLILFDGSVNALTHIDNAINDGMQPIFNAHPNTVLMHEPTCSVWPSKSPDLSLIKHIRDKPERRLQTRQNVPNNVSELRQALTEEWQAIPRERIRRVICSMRRRIQAVIDADGGHTRY